MLLGIVLGLVLTLNVILSALTVARGPVVVAAVVAAADPHA